MMLITKKDGTKLRLLKKEFKKYFADLMAAELKVEILKAVKENVKELDADGHSVYPPEIYIRDVKLPAEFVFELTQKHYSDYSDFKGTLTNSKFGLMDYVFGVNNLSMLHRLCNIVGWKKENREAASHMLGRGSEARVLHKNLVEKAAEITDEMLIPKHPDPQTYITDPKRIPESK
jgi:hypothetical protein